VGIAGPGGATLAFLLLILCGVSGAAVLDPALGAWGAAISSRAENLRAARSIASESRLAGVRLERPGLRGGATTFRIDARLPRAEVASDALTLAMVRAGSLDLPPPTNG
jgi:hypothetical protein